MPLTPTETYVAVSANVLQRECHEAALSAGWWTMPDGSDARDNPFCFSNRLALIHSEVSEAMEGDRKNLPDDKLPYLDMREVELADALIRIFDLTGAYNMNIGATVVAKLAFNRQRADHKPENRVQAGGKKY